MPNERNTFEQVTDDKGCGIGTLGKVVDDESYQISPPKKVTHNRSMAPSAGALDA